MGPIKAGVRGTHILTHGAAEHGHQVEKRIECLVIVLDIAQHNFRQPLALEPMGQGKE